MIPKEFTDKHLKKADGFKVFGIPIEELSRDELIASVIIANEQFLDQLESSKKEREFWRSVRK